MTFNNQCLQKMFRLEHIESKMFNSAKKESKNLTEVLFFDKILSVIKMENRRVKYTKEIIKSEFFKLMTVKPIDKITVREVCENADINRGTFYRYYTDLYELYQITTEETLQKAYECVIELAESSENDIKKTLIGVCHVVKSNKEFCEFSVSPNSGNAKIVERWIDKFLPLCILQWNDLFKNYTPEQLTIIYELISAGIIAALKHWISDNFKETEEELVTFILNFYLFGITDNNKNNREEQ